MPTPAELIDDLATSNAKRENAAVDAKRAKAKDDSDRQIQTAVFDIVRELTAALAGDKTKGEALGFILNKIEEFDSKLGGNSTELETLKAGMKQLETELAAVPVGDLKQLPKFLQARDKVQVTNFDKLERCLERVEEVLKHQKLVVKAPDVNVKAPIVDVKPADVHIPEIDWNPLLQELNGLRGEIRKQKTSSYDDEGSLQVTQKNLLIDVRYDEFRLVYDDFDEEKINPKLEKINYYYKSARKPVATIKFSYDDKDNLTGAKRA